MGPNRHLVAALIVLIVLPGLAAGGPQGSPDLSAFASDNRVTAGDRTTLGITLLNGGEVEVGGAGVGRVTTARNVRVTLRAGDAPIEVRTGTQPVGNVPEGAVGPIPFRIVVDGDADPGTYRLPVRVAYTYTSQIGSNGVHVESSKTVTFHVALVVEDDARFRIVESSAGAFSGGTGTVRLRVENVGSATAHDARLSLSSGAAELSFGGTPTATTFVGEWAPGETRTLAFEAGLVPGADRRSYPLSATVTYEDADGETRQSERLETGVTPGPRGGGFAVVNATADLAVGDRGTVVVRVRNTGDRRLSNARVAIRSGDPKLTFAGTATAETFVGEWAPGETRTLAFEAGLAEGADVRSYPLTATVTYENADGETRQSSPLSMGVTPDRRSNRFRIAGADADLAVGDTGTVRLRVTYVGDEPITDARFELRSGDPKVTFAGTPSSSVFVGEWGPGQTRTLAFTTSVASGAGTRPYPLTATVTYENADGETRQSDPLVTGITPRPEQSFALTVVESTLAVGEEGTVRGKVTNTANVTVRNAVVVFTANSPVLNPVETEYSVGDLAPGESATFSFEVGVGGASSGGPRQLSFAVRYRDANGDVRRSDPLDARVEVGSRRDVFDVRAMNATVAAGSGGTIALRVTNAGNETVTDVSAKLFADDPLSATDDEAFVDALAPGESTTIVFGISVAGGAFDKTYPVSLDFQYDDADGDTLLSDTYTVPVRVSSPTGGGLPILPAVVALVVLVVVAAGGYYASRRRR